MRDLLITGFFVAGLILTFRRPYIGALVWVLFGLMNPHRLAWGFAYSLPFSMVIAAAVAFSMMLNRKQVRWQSGAPVVFLVMLILWMSMTTLTAIHFSPSLSKYVDVLKVLGMTLVVGALVHDRKEILGLIWVVAGSIAFFGVKGGIFTIATGGSYHVWGPPSSLVNGNNELALALVITIPLLYFLASNMPLSRELPLARRVSGAWLKTGLYVAMVLCAAAALGSQSRGALLAISAMSAMLWWRSKSKVKLGIAMVLVAPAIVMVMPDAWFDRMETIQTYASDASAMGRINAWTMAANIANDRIMGAGFATASPFIYSLYAPDPTYVLVAHSIYFQMLGEHGYVGLALFLLFWGATYSKASRLMRLGKLHPDLRWVAQFGAMATVSLVGFAVGGAFLSLAYWDMPYYLMVLLLAIERYAVNCIEGSVPAAKPNDSFCSSPLAPRSRTADARPQA